MALHRTKTVCRRVLELARDHIKIGQGAAEPMSALERQYGDECEIGDVCTVAEVIGPHGSAVRGRSSAQRSHIAIGLLRVAEGHDAGDLRSGGEE